MKILVFSYDLHVLGGCGITLTTYADFLSSCGDIVIRTNVDPTDDWMLHHNFDIILTQQWSTAKASDLAYRLKIPLVMFVHGPDQYEYIFKDKTDKRCDLIVFITQEQLKNARPNIGFIPHVIINPLVIPQKCLVEHNTKEYITLIGTEMQKGVDVLLYIAKYMPDHKFLLVSDMNKDKIKEVFGEIPQNVLIERKHSDVRKVYCRTRILLMGSKFETYGRVAIEAAMSGIPTIATALQNIKDATNNNSVYISDRNNINDWIQAILEVDNNYEKYSTQALNLAKSKHPFESFVKLKTMLSLFE